MNNLAISVSGVKKKYKLGSIGGATLTEELQSKWAVKHGKDDPNAMVGIEYKRQRDFWALKGISFVVRRGEALGIIGANGAGKSTLLKLLSQITAPTEGEIRIKGKISSMLEVGTGFHGELTGRENIYLNGAILGMRKAEVDKKIEDIINFSECGEFIDTPVKRYSSGMYVKLAFSVAAHLDSEILIMDEVLAVGDVKFQQKCLKKMASLVNEENRTVLYVSHNMQTIRQLCDRCIFLEKGMITFDGDVEHAVEKYLRRDENVGIVVKKLENARRASNSLNKIKLLSTVLMGKQDNTFVSSDILELKLDFKILESCSNFFVRLIFEHEGERIASLISEETRKVYKDGEEYVAVMSIPLRKLTEGIYSIHIAFFTENIVRESFILEHVYKAVEFHIIPIRGQLKWESKWWGNIRFSDVKFQPVLKEKDS